LTTGEIEQVDVTVNVQYGGGRTIPVTGEQAIGSQSAPQLATCSGVTRIMGNCSSAIDRY
jgi:hypothetical protein